jgi:hypothetical protein
MQIRLLTFAGLMLLCLVVAASEPWSTLDGLIAGPRERNFKCNPKNKLVIRQMRPLLRRLFLSMVLMQRCKDDASRDICSVPPSKFQRHHHCRLLTLSQQTTQICADELQCQQPATLTCSSAWRSNIAALQWLFPRHAYCGDSKIYSVSERCDMHIYFKNATISSCLCSFQLYQSLHYEKLREVTYKKKN